MRIVTSFVKYSRSSWSYAYWEPEPRTSVIGIVYKVINWSVVRSILSNPAAAPPRTRISQRPRFPRTEEFDCHWRHVPAPGTMVGEYRIARCTGHTGRRRSERQRTGTRRNRSSDWKLLADAGRANHAKAPTEQAVHRPCGKRNRSRDRTRKWQIGGDRRRSRAGNYFRSGSDVGPRNIPAVMNWRSRGRQGERIGACRSERAGRSRPELVRIY